MQSQKALRTSTCFKFLLHHAAVRARVSCHAKLSRRCAGEQSCIHSGRGRLCAFTLLREHFTFASEGPALVAHLVAHLQSTTQAGHRRHPKGLQAASLPQWLLALHSTRQRLGRTPPGRRLQGEPLPLAPTGPIMLCGPCRPHRAAEWRERVAQLHWRCRRLPLSHQRLCQAERPRTLLCPQSACCLKSSINFSCRATCSPMAVAAMPARGTSSSFGSAAAAAAAQQQRRQQQRRQLGKRLVVHAERDFYQILGVARDAGASSGGDACLPCCLKHLGELASLVTPLPRASGLHGRVQAAKLAACAMLPC